MIRQIKGWTAKRAGGRITVYGEDVESGEKARITSVDMIAPDDRGRVIATRLDGELIHLIVG